MPIIPRYNLTQTSTHVSIEVSIPHVRVSTSTLDLAIVDGVELHFYAPPTYLLKLTLPGRVVDEDAVEDSLSRSAIVGNARTDIIRVVELDGGESEGGASSDVNEEHTARAQSTESTADAHVWTREHLPKLQYNPEKNHGTLVIVLRKEEDGYWPDLDLLGRLQQQPKKNAQAQQNNATSRLTKPLVEVVDDHAPRASSNKPLVEVIDDDPKNIHSNDVSRSSEVVMDGLLSINNQKRPTYGLFRHFSNVFRDYARDGLSNDMLECPDPDEVHSSSAGDVCCEESDRREMRLETENKKFDSDRYLNDLCVEEEGDMIYDSAMAMEPHWVKPSPVLTSVDEITNQFTKLDTSDSGENSFFTSEESLLLATIASQSKHCHVELSMEQNRSAFFSITDILFAYAYDHRTTDGDPTVESSWTVMILSPSLSWLENYNPPYDTVSEVVQWVMRRSLIYPYLRSYALARKVVDDVASIVKGGRRTILRCLLQLHQVMEKSESHYLFNKLYIDPSIGWIQQLEEIEVHEYGKELEALLLANNGGLLCKQRLGLGLVELEKSFQEYCNHVEGSNSSEIEEILL